MDDSTLCQIALWRCQIVILGAIAWYSFTFHDPVALLDPVAMIVILGVDIIEVILGDGCDTCAGLSENWRRKN